MSPVTICNIICALAKNGSFGFAKRWLVWAKVM
jgi:hypothetical protein